VILTKREGLMNINREKQIDIGRKEKITAAVMGGVNAYIKSEEEGFALSILKGRRSGLTSSSWGMNGRQEMMQVKRMWQMRWFK